MHQVILYFVLAVLLARQDKPSLVNGFVVTTSPTTFRAGAVLGHQPPKRLSAATSDTLESQSSRLVVDDETKSAPAAVQESPNKAPSPVGREENSKFRCDSSVEFWRTFESRGNEGNLDAIRTLVQRHARLNNARQAAYWSSQLLRTSYFAANAALGSLGSDFHERFVANRGRRPQEIAQQQHGTRSALGYNNGGSFSSNLLSSDVPSRLILEALQSYEQDWKHVESGLMNLPWDGIAMTDENDGLRVQWDQ